MKKQQITSPKLRKPSGHFAHAIKVTGGGDIVFVSGMVAAAADGSIVGVGDIDAQTRQVCENLKAAMEEAGGTLDDICRVDVFVRNMEHFPEIHAVRREYFTGMPPASTMVEINPATMPSLRHSLISTIYGPIASDPARCTDLQSSSR